MAGYWWSLPTDVQGAYIQAAGTILAATFAVAGLAVQLRSQARQTRAAILETEARKLKMRMYEEGVSVSRDLADRTSDLSVRLVSTSAELKAELGLREQGVQGFEPRARFAEIADDFTSFSEAAIKFIFLVENRRVIDPRIIIYRDVLSSILHDARSLMHERFVTEVMPVLPVDFPDGRKIRAPVTKQQIEAAIPALDALFDRVGDAGSLVEDFTVEIQNLLLGDLFSKEVAHRVPIDPAKFVISLDRQTEIEARLRDTEWGRECAKQEAAAKARIAAQG